MEDEVCGKFGWVLLVHRKYFEIKIASIVEIAISSSQNCVLKQGFLNVGA